MSETCWIEKEEAKQALGFTSVAMLNKKMIECNLFTKYKTPHDKYIREGYFRVEYYEIHNPIRKICSRVFFSKEGLDLSRKRFDRLYKKTETVFSGNPTTEDSTRETGSSEQGTRAST